jgi:hypothetical protein
MKQNKKAIAMSFNWIFAIIVGGFILFLAIYGASRFIGTQEQVLYTETAAKLATLLDPLETGLASGKSAEINFKKISRIYFECDHRTNAPFGKERLSFSEQTFGDKFGEEGELVAIYNKYVFAENPLEGQTLHMFSVPFFLPFKVADIIIISTNDYCFYNAPDSIEEEIEGLNVKNIIFPNKTTRCAGISVCFDAQTGSKCDISVNLEEKYVLKEGRKFYYVDNLIYGAIFSTPDIYECNVKRLKAKLDELIKIYRGKIDIIERKGCQSKVGGKLEEMIGPIEDSRSLIELYESAQVIDSINEGARSGCKLF